MKSIAILEAMVKDHGKLVKLLHDVEKSLDLELVSLMKVFDTFAWELEKHIFIEEKAIFSSYSPTNITDGYKMVPDLIAQQNELLNDLRVMRKALMWKKPANFKHFKERMLTHKTYEEVSL